MKKYISEKEVQRREGVRKQMTASWKDEEYRKQIIAKQRSLGLRTYPTTR
jgi:hypothetical protein